jgi:hypothetical protein
MTNPTGIARRAIQLSAETRQNLLCNFASLSFTSSFGSEHTTVSLLLNPVTRTRLLDKWLDTLE